MCHPCARPSCPQTLCVPVVSPDPDRPRQNSLPASGLMPLSALLAQESIPARGRELHQEAGACFLQGRRAPRIQGPLRRARATGAAIGAEDDSEPREGRGPCERTAPALLAHSPAHTLALDPHCMVPGFATPCLCLCPGYCSTSRHSFSLFRRHVWGIVLQRAWVAPRGRRVSFVRSIPDFDAGYILPKGSSRAPRMHASFVCFSSRALQRLF